MWVFLLLFQLGAAFFPGRIPDEGDVRHIYPISSIAIGFYDHAHMLPYILGWLENIDYPKSSLHIELHLLGKEDSTRDQVLWWKSTVSDLFKSITIIQDSENWAETALRNSRLKKSSKILITTGNNLLRNPRMLQDLSSVKEHLVVTAFMSSVRDSESSNIANVDILEERTILNETVFPLLIQLDKMDSSYLTFDWQNLPNYDEEKEVLHVFSMSAKRMNIEIYLDPTRYYGVFFSDHVDFSQQRRSLRYHLCDLIADDATLPEMSRTVRPWIPNADLFEFNKIYLINLKRRPDRLKKMSKIFEILGIEFTVLEATDGHSLPKDLSIKPLPGYEDPIAKRPLKAGEIGCFLSHYRIWKEVVEKKMKRIIVFEDDLRFSMDGMERVREALQDLDTSRKDWDLIYLGRKKMSQDQDELWVPEHHHLSTVGYSYWTLGYMLSLSGAQKLLNAKPLEKLVPVDEYLPIMFDKHPNKDWVFHFPLRNLKAFTLYPLVVFPQRYTHEEGYISDTEDSHLLPDVSLTRDEL